MTSIMDAFCMTSFDVTVLWYCPYACPTKTLGKYATFQMKKLESQIEKPSYAE